MKSMKLISRGNIPWTFKRSAHDFMRILQFLIHSRGSDEVQVSLAAEVCQSRQIVEVGSGQPAGAQSDTGLVVWLFDMRMAGELPTTSS